MFFFYENLYLYEKMSKVTGYKEEQLREMHPKLAKVFEQILESAPPASLRLKYMYYSKYKTTSHPGKVLSLNRIINVVEENGYKIDITPIKQ